MTTETATISSDRLSAEISTLGAELQFLKDGKGNELLWDGDPAFWRGRAPILFPVIGLLEGGSYRLDSVSYRMPKHGFARDSLFTIVERTPEAATFRLAASPATREIYPFEFRLDISFSISDAKLMITAIVSNNSNTSMPASFGFHPALRWPLPYGEPRELHRVRFEHDEPAPVRRIDTDGFLLPDPLPTPVVGDTLELRDDLFVDDALIFDRLESRKLSYGAATGPRLAVEFADFPTLGIWTKPCAGFVCIEPWQGIADPVGYVGDIRDKPGIIEIAPGTNKALSMNIRLID